jgi:hypothetical protein
MSGGLPNTTPGFAYGGTFACALMGNKQGVF